MVYKIPLGRVMYVIGWELRALLRNLASSRCLKSVEQFFFYLIRLWIFYIPFVIL
ncbi:hypothetical protein HanXRQr2_Chr08g0332801 [Helianthus annuus]|uniref:Uncharacterized protein n=1 Tax=Helianthus annuus TaxID=4232 RepID=A0A9K3IDL2_HELAN|nr:hypothetical protein HanXRQr2_Chr08g0332801 [Helianthus annuus]